MYHLVILRCVFCYLPSLIREVATSRIDSWRNILLTTERLLQVRHLRIPGLSILAQMQMQLNRLSEIEIIYLNLVIQCKLNKNNKLFED